MEELKVAYDISTKKLYVCYPELWRPGSHIIKVYYKGEKVEELTISPNNLKDILVAIDNINLDIGEKIKIEIDKKSQSFEVIPFINVYEEDGKIFFKAEKKWPWDWKLVIKDKEYPIHKKEKIASINIKEVWKQEELKKEDIKIYGLPPKLTNHIKQAMIKIFEKLGIFKRKCKVIIMIGHGGTTLPEPGISDVEWGDLFIVQAYPDQGFKFEHWLVNNVKKYSNPLYLRITEDTTIVPVFKKIIIRRPPPPPVHYTLRVIIEGGGSVIVEKYNKRIIGEETITYSDQINLIAEANTGFKLKYWDITNKMKWHEVKETLTLSGGNYTVKAVFSEYIDSPKMFYDLVCKWAQIENFLQKYRSYLDLGGVDLWREGFKDEIEKELNDLLDQFNKQKVLEKTYIVERIRDKALEIERDGRLKPFVNMMISMLRENLESGKNRLRSLTALEYLVRIYDELFGS